MRCRTIWRVTAADAYIVEAEFTISSLNRRLAKGESVLFKDPFLTIDGVTSKTPQFQKAIEKKWVTLVPRIAPPPQEVAWPTSATLPKLALPLPIVQPSGIVVTVEVDGVETSWVVPEGRRRAEFVKWLSNLSCSSIRTALSEKLDLQPLGWVMGKPSASWVEWVRAAVPIELEF